MFMYIYIYQVYIEYICIFEVYINCILIIYIYIVYTYIPGEWVQESSMTSGYGGYSRQGGGAGAGAGAGAGGTAAYQTGRAGMGGMG
jgi:hypothetical protein